METITFEDLGLDGMSLEAVEAKGFTTPTPIQILAIPRLLNGEATLLQKQEREQERLLHLGCL